MKQLKEWVDINDPIQILGYEKENLRRAHRLSRKTKRITKANRGWDHLHKKAPEYKRWEHKDARRTYLDGIEDDTYFTRYKVNHTRRLSFFLW